MNAIRYGYRLPVFGGWLRNVDDERVEASWDYVRRLAQWSEQIGYDLTLIAELFLNDIKGIEAPSLASLRRPFRRPRQSLCADEGMADGRRWRVATTVVHLRGTVLQCPGDGRRTEAGSLAASNDLRRRRVGCSEDPHRRDLRRVRHARRSTRSHRRPHCGPEPAARSPGPPADAVRNGGVRRRSQRRTKARAELERITNVSPGSPGYQNYQDWVSNTKLEQRVSLEDYSASNRGLRAGFVGTPGYVADRIQSYRDIGIDLLLLQCSPQLEEMERFAAEVIPLAGDSSAARHRDAPRPSAPRWSPEEGSAQVIPSAT